jgi:molybdopterin-guanine dinucleotide biosynthesis protein A
MGQDKALLRYDGQSLIERAVHQLKVAGLEPRIVGTRPDLSAYAPVIEDLHPGCGPLGGIEAALASSSSEWNVFLSVDLPLLPPAFLRYILERAHTTASVATVPALAGRPQPLCAVYHSSLLPGIQHSLEAGEFKVMRGIEDAAGRSEIDIFSVEAVVTARGEWPPEPPLHQWFQNINTPADMALLP